MLYLQHIKTSQRRGIDKWLLWSVIVPLFSHSPFPDYYVAFWQRIWMVKLETATGDRGVVSANLVSVMILPCAKKVCRQRGILGGLCMHFAA